MSYTLLLPVLGRLAVALGVGEGVIGWAQSAIAVAGVALGLHSGFLADLLGRRLVLTASAALYAVAGAACVLAHSFPFLLTLRVIQGVGSTGLLTVGVVMLGDAFEGRQRDMAIGWSVAGLTAGSIVGPLLGGIIGSRDPFMVFLPFALAMLLIVPLRRVQDVRTSAVKRPHLIDHLRRGLAAFPDSRSRSNYLGAVPFILVAITLFNSVNFGLTPLLLDTYGALSSVARGGVLAVGSAASGISAVLTTRSRLRRDGLVAVGLASFAIGVLIFALFPTIGAVFVAQILVGMGVGVVYPTMQSAVAGVSPTEYRGTLFGAWTLAVRIGQLTGPVAGTYLLAAYGTHGSYESAAVVGGLLIASWVPLRSLVTRSGTVED